VLRELLGLDDRRIDELAQAGIVATRETAATP
jgi:hypothetical protein